MSGWDTYDDCIAENVPDDWHFCDEPETVRSNDGGRRWPGRSSKRRRRKSRRKSKRKSTKKKRRRKRKRTKKRRRKRRR
ncbi:hypothetical protein OAA99_02440 [Omnitrophica bacterium]|nr:hypothetical protein [Candidatus Omnitrophota bacterium]